jgi:hypothetical protein
MAQGAGHKGEDPRLGDQELAGSWCLAVDKMLKRFNHEGHEEHEEIKAKRF